MKHIILAGVATLALAASPVLAKPDGAKGGGNGGGGGPAKVERGGGGAKAQRGPDRQVRVDRQERRADRQVRVERQERRADRQERRIDREDRVKVREVRNRDLRRDDVRDDRDVRLVDRRDDRNFANRGFVDNCPPGLAAKDNGCLPPGQARKLVGLAAPAALGGALLPTLYRSWYPDDSNHYYRTEGGYAYRIDRERNLIDAFFPLGSDYDGDYYVGGQYPQDYLGYYNVPAQYRPWYADNGDDLYRYADGAIYRVDRQGGLIEGIVSLLAGDLALGQPLPTGYDVYNVPYAYRDRYADDADSWYRYNDGNIYQIDPTTRLVQAIVETLV